jgi:hypothetical protein
VGHCAACQSWLGDKDGAAFAQHYEIFKAAEVEALIQKGGANQCCFPWNVSFLISHILRGNTSALARVLKVDRKTIDGWKAGVQMPKLESVLLISFCFGLTATDLLFKRLSPDDAICVQNESPTARKTLRKYDREEVRNTLEHALSGSPQSLTSVCQQIECDAGYVAQLFPKLARQISHRYRRFVAQRKHQRLANLQVAVRSAVLKFHQNGIYPSHRKVNRELPRSGGLQHPIARQTWKTTLKELRLSYERTR